MNSKKNLIDKYFKRLPFTASELDEFKKIDKINIEDLDWKSGMKKAALILRGLDLKSVPVQIVYFHILSERYIKTIKLDDLQKKYAIYLLQNKSHTKSLIEIIGDIETNFVDKYKIGIINPKAKLTEILMETLVTHNTKDKDIEKLLHPFKENLDLQKDELEKLENCIIGAKYNPNIRLTAVQKNFAYILCDNYRYTVQETWDNISWNETYFLNDMNIDTFRLFLMGNIDVPLLTYKNFLEVVEFDKKGRNISFFIPKHWGKQKCDNLFKRLWLIRKKNIPHRPSQNQKRAILNIIYHVLKYNRSRKPDNYSPEKLDSWRLFADSGKKIVSKYYT